MAIEVVLKSEATTLADYKDILVYSITVLSIIVASLSVFAAYFLGRKYADHVNEIQLISGNYTSLRQLYEESQRFNKSILAQLSVGSAIIVRLFVLRARIEDMTFALHALRTNRTWLGKPIDLELQSNYEQRLLFQIGKCKKQYKAREFEMMCVSSGNHSCGGYLRSLVESVGDQETINFLQACAKMVDNEPVRSMYLSMIGELSYRLRSHAPENERAFVDSSLWTGRETN